MGQEREPCRAVLVIRDNVVAGMAATRDMIDSTGEVLSERTRMGEEPTPCHCRIARPDPVWKDRVGLIRCLPGRVPLVSQGVGRTGEQSQ